jgi:glycosyltransferase involved in cell wall biosynthesis
MHIVHITLGKTEMQWQYQVNRMVHLLVEEQRQAGWNVDVWCIADRKAGNYGTSKNALVFETRGGLLMELKQHIMDYPGACYHFHGAWSMLFVRLSAFCEKKGIKFVITTHGEYSYNKLFGMGLLSRCYFSWIEKRMLKRAQRVHTMNKLEHAFLSAEIGNEKMVYLNWGFKSRRPLVQLPKNKSFTIGYIAKLNDNWTELQIIIEAFRKFRSVYTDAEFWIIGDGKGLTEVLRYVERENIEGVRSWGEKYGSEKDEIIMQMHVLVYAPTAKDLALPVLEAAACSVPSIVAVESNIVDWLGRMPCFQFAKGQSEQEWIKAMASVFHCYSGEQFEQSVEGMRNLLNETFNWEKLIPRYRKLYQI